MGNGNGLGDFLRARRAQVTPADVGLSCYGARRVAGLRREEVASLAGVSVAYYSAREHLHVLVRSTRSRSTGRAAKPEHAREELVSFLDRHVDAPAMVLGRALDVLAANRLAQALHPSYCPGHNLALDVFLDETAQARYTDPGQVRRNRVSSLRAAAAALPGDARLVEVIGELSIRSAAFRELWAQHEIRARSAGTKRFTHPEVGELELRYSFFSVSGSERQDLIVYHPEPRTRHAQSVVLLETLAAEAAGAAKPVTDVPAANDDPLYRPERGSLQ